MTIILVTDSASDIPPELAKQHGIRVIPLNVMINDTTFKDGIDIQIDEFNKYMFEEDILPKTSQPSPTEFLNVYQEIINQGDSIISIHISSKVSGTLNSATQAKAMLGTLPENQFIEIIDTKLASIPVALIAIEVAQSLKTNPDWDFQAQVSVAETITSKTSVYLAIDTLEYLEKGGRIGKASALLGSLLRIKPILSMSDGEVVPISKSRSLSQSIQRLTHIAQSAGQLHAVAIIYNTNYTLLDEIEHQIALQNPEITVIRSRFGPVVGTYVGPNAVGIAMITK
jgi:DegV family protein with EDD domain